MAELIGPGLPEVLARRDNQRMATAPAADIRVVDVPDRSRFEIRVDLPAHA
jgi:hypothetical protein